MASKPLVIDLLTEVGLALFGPRWQSETGKALGVSDRTVRRWVAGDPIPEENRPKLRRIIDSRIVLLKRVRRRLD
jgi:hypothetical protein